MTEPRAAARSFASALPMIRLSLAAGHALASHDLDDLYALRGRFMRLKSSADPAYDRAKFDAFMRNASHVMRGHDERGALRMMITVDRRELVVDGRPVIIHFGEYGFLDLDYRGHPGLFLLYLRVAARDLLGRTPVYASGLGYPPAVLAIARALGAPICPGADNDRVVRACFDDLIERVGSDGCDRVTGRTSMRTVPPDPPAWWWKLAERDPVYRAYTERCPDWRDGYAVLALIPLDRAALRGVIVGGIRRTVKHVRRAIRIALGTSRTGRGES